MAWAAECPFIRIFHTHFWYRENQKIIGPAVYSHVFFDVDARSGFELGQVQRLIKPISNVHPYWISISQTGIGRARIIFPDKCVLWRCGAVWLDNTRNQLAYSDYVVWDNSSYENIKSIAEEIICKHESKVTTSYYWNYPMIIYIVYVR